MDQPHYTKLWSAIGLALSFYALNAWIASQGGKPFIAGGLLLEDRPVLTAIVAIPICAALPALTAELGIRHARGTRDQPWHARLPVVWLTGLKTGSCEGMLYQVFFLLLFIVMPVAALVHFVDKSFQAEVLHRATGARGSWWHPPAGDGFWGVWNAFAIEREGAVEADMITWWPVWELVVFAALLAAAVWRVGILLAVVFRRPHELVTNSAKT